MFIIFYFTMFIFSFCSCFESDLLYKDLLMKSSRDLQSSLMEGFSKLSKKKDFTLTPLLGGYSSSKLYTFSLKDHKYVLRILHPVLGQSVVISELLRKNEVFTQLLTAKNGLCPAVHFADKKNLMIIMDYCPYPLLTRKMLSNETIMINLGKKIKTLHSIIADLPSEITELDNIKHHYLNIKKNEIATPTGFNNSFENYIENQFLLEGEKVLCHGDLNPNNIFIFNDEPIFIDWASAQRSNPYVDLGYIATMSQMDEHQVNLLLQGYYGRKATEEELKLLKFAMARVYFQIAITGFDFLGFTESKEISLKQRIEKMDNLLLSIPSASYYLSKRSHMIDLKHGSRKDIEKFFLSFYKQYFIEIKNLNS